MQPASAVDAAKGSSSTHSVGLLKGLSSKDVVSKGINLYAPELTVEDLWGTNPPSGGAFLDAVLEFYGIGVFDVPFFFEGPNGEKMRAIERSPLSRELQEATAQEYKDRILRESISQVAAGEPIFRGKTSQQSWPCEAGSWNHRAEAVYRAIEEAPASPNVEPVLRRGLVRVKFVHSQIPFRVWQRFINVHNTFHKGSGQNFQDFLLDASTQEAEWEAHVAKIGMHSQNPNYRASYRDFVLEKSMYFNEWDTFRKALSLVHMLKRLKIHDDLKSFWNRRVDFIGAEMDPMSVISTMHSVALLVTGNMMKFYSLTEVGTILNHALRHCVPKAENTSSGERLPAWSFKHFEHDAGRMNIFNLPMAESTVCRKLKVEEHRNDEDTSAPKPSASGSGKRSAVPAEVLSDLRDLGVAGSKKQKTNESAVDCKASELLGDVDMEAGVEADQSPDLSVEPGCVKATGQSQLKLKKSDKKLSFSPYSENEKISYRTIVTPQQSEGVSADDALSRPVTALDDFMQCIKHAERLVLDMHGDVVPKESLESTFSFCAGLFLQFLFEGRVCLRGKDLRVWSAARPEIQATYIAAMDFVRAPANTLADGTSVAGGSGSTGKAPEKRMNAIELAKLLCQSFVAQPVQTLVMGDDEAVALKRVATIMSTEYNSIALPLKKFVANQLKLPINFHEIVVHAVRTFMTTDSKRMEMVDMVCQVQSDIEKSLPFHWVAFGVDVAELFANQKQFVEGTQEVFQTTENLEKFLLLRLKYLLNIVSAACSSGADFALTDVPSTSKQFDFFGKLPTALEPHLDSLAAFDNILSSKDWGVQWAQILKGSTCAADVAKLVNQRLRLTEGSDQAGDDHKLAKDSSLLQRLRTLPRSTTGPRSDVWVLNRASDETEQAQEGKTNGAPKNGDPGESNGAGDGHHGANDPDTTLLASFNNFMTDDLKKKGADDFTQLKLGYGAGGAAFYRKVESSLNNCLMEIYQALTLKESSVQINVKSLNDRKAKSDGIQVTMPVPSEFRLPFVSRLTPINSKGSIWCTKIFGVDFFMDNVKEPLATDLCVPAWTVRTVSRADQAYFDSSHYQEKVVIYHTGGHGELSIDAKYLGLQNVNGSHDDSPIMQDIVKNNRPHIVVTLSIQCLQPVNDLDTKLTAEIDVQRKNVEKQIRTMVGAAVKAKVKAKKKQSKSVNKDDGEEEETLPKQEKFVFETLGIDAPASREESIATLKGLLEQEKQFEELIQKAKQSIQKPKTIPLTRLQAEEDRIRQNRAKLMQVALEQAQKRSTGADNSGSSTNSIEDIQFGFSAARRKAEQDGTLPKAKEKGKKSKNALVKDVLQMAKHMLK